MQLAAIEIAQRHEIGFVEIFDSDDAVARQFVRRKQLIKLDVYGNADLWSSSRCGDWIESTGDILPTVRFH